MLALALGHGPELLILDDPTLGLDVVARNAVFGEVIGELADRGTTVFITTHDLAGSRAWPTAWPSSRRADRGGGRDGRAEGALGPAARGDLHRGRRREGGGVSLHGMKALVAIAGGSCGGAG